MEYVFLSVVTRAPFWLDHRAVLDAASEALGVKTTFAGPLDFDTAAQARQLDELVARRPAGILIFPGDMGALVLGINRTAVSEAGRKGEIKIASMDRNDDMQPYIEDGTIVGAVAQKSFAEALTAVHLLHWLNTNATKAAPCWRETGSNPLPISIKTGVMRITAESVAQFQH